MNFGGAALRKLEEVAVSDSGTGHDRQLDAENRQLKATINALRLRLEEAQAQESARVQAALAASQAEVVQLKSTIDALRTEINRLQGETGKRIEDSAAAARDENRQLRQMIIALRAQLEQRALAA